MSEFKLLDQKATSLLERWLNFEKMKLSAEIETAQAEACISITELIESKAKSPDEITLSQRIMLLRRRADAIETEKLAIEKRFFARSRYIKLFNSWKSDRI